jgi:hypothetical protein
MGTRRLCKRPCRTQAYRIGPGIPISAASSRMVHSLASRGSAGRATVFAGDDAGSGEQLLNHRGVERRLSGAWRPANRLWIDGARGQSLNPKAARFQQTTTTATPEHSLGGCQKGRTVDPARTVLVSPAKRHEVEPAAGAGIRTRRPGYIGSIAAWPVSPSVVAVTRKGIDVSVSWGDKA